LTVKANVQTYYIDESEMEVRPRQTRFFSVDLVGIETDAYRHEAL
jgi:hypothetical protein